MTYLEIIANAYDAGVADEYNRLCESPLREVEFQLIIDLINEYVSSDSVVIDIGSGPGRYAEYLLHRNCKVGVVDLSAKSLKAFSDRIISTKANQNVLFNKVSCATQLNWIENNCADAILLMGPLYHLIDVYHQSQALKHCKRILKPNGYLFSVFLSPFPLICRSHEKGSLLYANQNLYNHIKSEMISHTHFKGYQVPQYRCWPSKAIKLMCEHGFKTLRLKNIEGIGMFLKMEQLLKFSTFEKKKLLFEWIQNFSEKTQLIGITHQYMHVGQKRS